MLDMNLVELEKYISEYAALWDLSDRKIEVDTPENGAVLIAEMAFFLLPKPVAAGRKRGAVKAQEQEHIPKNARHKSVFIGRRDMMMLMISNPFPEESEIDVGSAVV